MRRLIPCSIKLKEKSSMYTFKCDKNYDIELNMPDFYYRYSKILNSEKKNIIILKEKFEHSTFRYRGYNVIQSMQNNEKYTVESFLISEIPGLYEILDKIDLVILQRAYWFFDLASFISVLKDNHITVIYDMDDLIYSPKFVPIYLNSTSRYSEKDINHFFGHSKRLEMIAEMADGFIVTTKSLSNHIKEDFNKPTWIFHNFLNLEQETAAEEIIKLKKRSYSDDKFIIGYFSGSNSHKRDLEIAEQAIIKLMNKYDDIYLKIVGYMSLSSELKKLKDSGRIILTNFVSFEELEYEIGQVDLNIIPLQKHEFNECKSELKYFEASIVNTLTCATNNSVYTEVINDGVDGFLSDELSWFDKMEYIYLNYPKLTHIINSARKKCLEEYGNKKQEKYIEKLYDELFEFQFNE